MQLNGSSVYKRFGNLLCNELRWVLGLFFFLYSSKFVNTNFVSLNTASASHSQLNTFHFSSVPLLEWKFPAWGWVQTEINDTILVKCIEMRYHEAAKWFTLLANFLASWNPFLLLCGEFPSSHPSVIRRNSPRSAVKGNYESLNKSS